MVLCKLLCAVVPVVVAVLVYRRNVQFKTDREHLAELLCVTNGLRPLYEELRANKLAAKDLQNLVESCRVEPGKEADLPLLTADGDFLGSFFVRNCGAFQEAAEGKRRSGRATTPVPDAHVEDFSFSRAEPSLLQLTDAEREKLFPRWLWDVSQAPGFEEQLKGQLKGFKIEAQLGFEAELALFPLLTQNLSGKTGQAATWRNPWDVVQSKKNLDGVLDYEPDSIWMEPEIWVQRKGKETTFHYDYDPFNLVFQVYGSRRFHLLPPQSGVLAYTPENIVKDYGTRWAKQLFYNSTTGEYVADLKPKDVLYVPNGWPHKVTYLDDSIGRAVRSWTQCQALSLFLGRRLCTLSATVGATRICFDDEIYREHNGISALEGVAPVQSR
mmetsp:Transcript_36601/g.59051  ORF Transcript_36601/g.59051 Transcript_36601/m.59051 type:complete len:384 (-) Transcript_36601:46-1197(-)